MEKKITASLFLMALIPAIIAVAISSAIYHTKFQNQVVEELQVNANLLASAYKAADGKLRLSDINIDGRRVVLLTKEGKLLYDSSGRYDLEEDLDYAYTVPLFDENCLMVSGEPDALLRDFSASYPALLGIVIILVLFSSIIAVRFTARLLKSLRDQHIQIKNKFEQHKRMEQLRQEFTANVSHELKTPLTSISGYAEMIETGFAKTEDVQGFAAIIHKESRRLLRLISDIIKLSELDGGEGQIVTEELSLMEIAKECISFLKLSAEKNGIHMVMEGEGGRINGNRTLITELVYNLCDNAIRYNRENGSVRLLIEGSSLTVEDNGIGIPAEDQRRIFERFYRVDKSRSKETGGTGLGLAIVKHIAEQHGAKLKVDSQIGLGTRVTVSFELDR